VRDIENEHSYLNRLSKWPGQSLPGATDAFSGLFVDGSTRRFRQDILNWMISSVYGRVCIARMTGIARSQYSNRAHRPPHGSVGAAGI